VKLGFTSPQGAEKVVEIIGPGQSFGEALMFLEKPYIVFARALEDCMLLHISKRVMFEELRREPEFARKVISGLARRLHGLVKDVEAYTLRSGAERVIGYLLRDAPSNGGGNVTTITLNAGKSVIASRLNMTPEHFSRILHELQSDGLIEVNGRSIRIPDLARLSG
jgi:CRP-like cAMP-binding protein